MTDSSNLGLPEAARRLGVSLRVLRGAMRAGKIPAPQHLTATSRLPAGWLEAAHDAIKQSPDAFSRTAQKVPAFARYHGTSAWRKYTNRVRAYAIFRAAPSA